MKSDPALSSSRCSCRTSTDDELASSLAELERLATTLGLRPIGARDPAARAARVRRRARRGQARRSSPRWTGGTGVVPTYGSEPGKPRRGRDADDEPTTIRPRPRASRARTVVLVDHDLTPTQQRNLEKATGADVLDRTSVILEIFHRHARTREARLQVEIARLKYLAPRLREGAGGGDRVRGGIGGKGAGESCARARSPPDPRSHRRAARTSSRAIEGGAKTRRERRSELPTVALVGYTNAGKSSLMRALTSDRGLRRRQAVRDARHDRAAPAAADRAADPRLRHGRLHQEAAARPRRVVPVDPRRGRRRRPPAPRRRRRATPRCRTSSRSRARCSARSAPISPSWLLLNKIDRVDAARPHAPRRALPRRHPAVREGRRGRRGAPRAA